MENAKQHGRGQLGSDAERHLEFFPVVGGELRVLSDAHIEEYNARGFTMPVEVFSSEEVAGHRAYFDQLVDLAAAEGHDQYSIMNWHHRCDGLWDLAYHPRILDIMEELLGPNLVCFRAHYFAKLPAGADDKQVSWHQDSPYWPLTPSKAATLWLAIDDVDLGNAPMQFVPGSHLHGKIPYRQSAAEENNVLNLTVDGAESFGGVAVPAVLKAGQASLHSDLLLHGSEANTSDRRRVGLALSYFTPDVRSIISDRRGFGWLCRGEDSAGYWAPRPERPVGNRIPRKKPSPQGGGAKL